jgi:flagellar hook protein FlgE
MALTNALFTGLSGLDVNQTRLNVVGNNIANANTTAFKSSRALFKPQFYVTDNAGTSPSADFGGTNPNQRGLGATVSAIDRDFSTGSIEPTGRDTDMAIDGSGFFIVQGAEQRFTRDGSFSLNAANQLITQGGDFVQGYSADDDGNVIPSGLSNVTIPLGTATTAKATTKVKLQGNLNSDGAVATGASILTSQLLTSAGGTAPPTAATLLTDVANNATPGTPLVAAGDKFSLEGKKGGRKQPVREFEVTPASTVGDLMTFLGQGMGVNTDVPDDGNALTPVPGGTVETDGTVTTAGRLVLAGNLGKENELNLEGLALTKQDGTTPFTLADGTNAAGITSNAAGESVHTSFQVYDSLGTEVDVDLTAVLESKSNAGNTWRFFATSGDDTDVSTAIATGTLTFDTQGVLKETTGGAITINREGTGAKEPLGVAINFDGLTSLTAANNGGSTVAMTQQDGYQIGVLDTFSIGTDGKVIGQYSNGQSKALGQVALATFANNGGLVDRGGNQFGVGADSGVPVISAPQELGSGSIRGASLEQSNVDISKEFVNLIISSTGFTAASRVISTSDQLITELLNTSR